MADYTRGIKGQRFRVVSSNHEVRLIRDNQGFVMVGVMSKPCTQCHSTFGVVEYTPLHHKDTITDKYLTEIHCMLCGREQT